MTMMVAEVCDALLATGAPEDKALKAAEAVASYDNRFNKVDADFAKVNTDLSILKWMVGLVVADVVALITKTFF